MGIGATMGVAAARDIAASGVTGDTEEFTEAAAGVAVSIISGEVGEVGSTARTPD